MKLETSGSTDVNLPSYKFQAGIMNVAHRLLLQKDSRDFPSPLLGGLTFDDHFQTSIFPNRNVSHSFLPLIKS